MEDFPFRVVSMLIVEDDCFITYVPCQNMDQAVYLIEHEPAEMEILEPGVPFTIEYCIEERA